MMKIAHEIVREYIAAHNIHMLDFNEWFVDAGYPQDAANIHDSRYMHHLEQYVEERDSLTN